MTIVSYAQNFEDVMLLRALRDVAAGTYVDVGAHDPDEFSVTKMFYERGWRGINVEPVADYFARLEAGRPEDINLHVAAGAVAGTMDMYVIPGTGLSTFVEQHASAAAERGFPSVTTTVAVETLDRICARLPTPELHFLKIDVEGAEGDVLRGIDLERFRPWIVLVEATLPGTPDVSYAQWEPLLTEHRYRFVYFDGLNRFYVAEERNALVDAFAAPPNVFDEFVPWRQHVTDRQLEDVDRWITALPVGDDVAAAPDRVDRLRSSFGSLLRLSERLAGERSAVQADLQASEEARRLGEAEAQALRATVAARDEEIVAQAERAETTVAQWTDAVTALRATLAAVEQDLSSSREAVAAQVAAQVVAQDAAQAQHVMRMNVAQSEHAAQVDALSTALRSADERIARLEQRKEALDARVAAFLDSRSWRITAPLRAITRLITGRD